MSSVTVPLSERRSIPFSRYFSNVFLVCMAGGALASTPILTARLIINQSQNLFPWIGLSFALTTLLLLWHFHNSVTHLAVLSVRLTNPISLRTWLALGIVARAVWIVVFPAQPASDGKIYLELAQKLATGFEYETDGTYAYWPIGYPAFLALWMELPITGRVAYLLSNLLLYVVGFLGTVSLTTRLSGPSAGRVAGMLFAFWPNLVSLSGSPEKELLVIAVLPWATLFLLQTSRSHTTTPKACIAGALLGAATLVQPSLQFLPFAAVLFLAFNSSPRKTRAYNAIILVLGAAIIIAPWTVRNYHIFDRFVLVATNGGSNLYRANNALATGGYTPRGERDLSGLSEADFDSSSRRYAIDWIKNNPSRFAELAIEKQIRFMGDDATGVYMTFKAGRAAGGTIVYAILKLLANTWWMLAWAILAALVFFSANRSIRPDVFLPASIWMYLFAIHSVFESAGKYHVPALWALITALAVYAAACFGDGRQKGQT